VTKSVTRVQLNHCQIKMKIILRVIIVVITTTTLYSYEIFLCSPYFHFMESDLGNTALGTCCLSTVLQFRTKCVGNLLPAANTANTTVTHFFTSPDVFINTDICPNINNSVI
jgi:hypothetical protein